MVSSLGRWCTCPSFITVVMFNITLHCNAIYFCRLCVDFVVEDVAATVVESVVERCRVVDGAVYVRNVVEIAAIKGIIRDAVSCVRCVVEVVVMVMH